jgi:hypothetical protein
MLKSFFLTSALFVVGGLMADVVFPSTRRGGTPPEKVGVVPDDRAGLDAVNLDDYLNVDRWLTLESDRVRDKFGIEHSDPRFAAKLNEFVLKPEVKAHLEKKYDASWVGDFAPLLAENGGEIVGHDRYTVSFSFEGFPYTVIARLQAFPLGFYHPAEGVSYGFNCNPFCGPVSRSLFPFPLQLVSRILYAEEIAEFVRACGIKNVRAAQHWLFEFPWIKEGEEADAELDDENIFLVQERVDCNPEFHAAYLASLRAEYTPEVLSMLATVEEDRSLMANLARVIMQSGLWELSDSNYLFFVENPAIEGRVEAVIRMQERPAFGGGKAAFFFHQFAGRRTDTVFDSEINSNARVGVKSLLGIK